MKTPILILPSLTALGLLALTPCVPAQDEIVIRKEIEGGIFVKPIPITLSGFSGEVAQVLRFDLEVQGFKVVAGEGAQYDVAGGAPSGVQGRVTDLVNRQTVLAKAYTGGSLRAQAHALADDIVLALTHRKGIGQTKIAFKVDTGAASEVYIADFDGHGARQVTRDGSLIAAPVWVPGRLGLCYASYKLGTLDILRHNLTSGERSVLVRDRGSYFTPAVSPNGDRVAFISNRDGWPDVYVCGMDGTGIQRLTKSPQDESSPCWSPDGRWVLFAGKDGERRVLRKVPAGGGQVQNVPTVGVPNPSEPDWSPDGKWIVFTAQMGGFELCVVPAGGGDAIALVSGEDPSWAPNSRTVVFARRSDRGRSLSVLDVFTKQVKDVPGISGSNSQPSWQK